MGYEVNDNNAYIKQLRDLGSREETACHRCGECCGSVDGDPCSKLVKEPDGTYRCSVYSDRLGPQLTVSGKVFNCVTIREIKKYDALRPGCGYRKRSA